MPNRHNNTSDYRYGFNGMEADDEIKGDGNSYSTEFRHYDPRVGRWLSLDPLMQKYPYQSPYAAFNNNPIYYKDPTGLEGDPPFDGIVENAIRIHGAENVEAQLLTQIDEYGNTTTTGYIKIFNEDGSSYTIQYQDESYFYEMYTPPTKELAGGTFRFEGLPEHLLPNVESEMKDITSDNNELLSEGTLDAVQMGLDIVGQIPGLGEIADFANGIISLARGNYVDALISFGSMIPIVGNLGPILKYGDDVIEGVTGLKRIKDVKRAKKPKPGVKRQSDLRLDHTGKLHGRALPIPRSEWTQWGTDELRYLQDALKKSIEKRKFVNKTHPNVDDLPRHTRRLQEEIDFLRDITKFLDGK